MHFWGQKLIDLDWYRKKYIDRTKKQYRSRVGQITTNLSIFENNRMNLSSTVVCKNPKCRWGVQVKNCRPDRECYNVYQLLASPSSWSQRRPEEKSPERERQDKDARHCALDRCCCCPRIFLPQMRCFVFSNWSKLPPWNSVLLQFCSLCIVQRKFPIPLVTLGKLGAHLFVNRISSNFSHLQNLVKASA